MLCSIVAMRAILMNNMSYIRMPKHVQIVRADLLYKGRTFSAHPGSTI